jgi:hypothetical protein
MKLPDGAYLAEISDSVTSDLGLIGQVDWQDVVLGIALDIEQRRRTDQ